MSQLARLRSGTSLVEMLVLISLGAVVLGGVVTGSTALLQANNRFAASADDRCRVMALAAQLRSNLHQATAAEWSEERQRLELQTASGSVSVFTNADGQVDQTIGQHTKRWRLPEGGRFVCGRDRCEQGQVIEIEIHTAAEARPTRVVALLGRDLPHDASEESTP